MAYNSLLIAIIVAAFAAPAFAIDHVVGDNDGWRLGVNYTAWTQGKQFNLRDRLIFNYGEGAHNVYRVSGANFRQCSVPSDVAPLTTGNDIVTLATSGRKWYICGVGSHCDAGMKFVITVSSQESSEVSGSKQKSPFSSGCVMLVILSFIVMMFV